MELYNNFSIDFMATFFKTIVTYLGDGMTLLNILGINKELRNCLFKKCWLNKDGFMDEIRFKIKKNFDANTVPIAFRSIIRNITFKDDQYLGVSKFPKLINVTVETLFKYLDDKVIYEVKKIKHYEICAIGTPEELEFLNWDEEIINGKQYYTPSDKIKFELDEKRVINMLWPVNHPVKQHDFYIPGKGWKRPDLKSYKTYEFVDDLTVSNRNFILDEQPSFYHKWTKIYGLLPKGVYDGTELKRRIIFA